MVCVPKPNRQLSVCISFQILNKDNVNHTYTMHSNKKKLKAMTGDMVFNTLDLTKGYHHLFLHPKSKPIKAFSSPKGLIQREVFPLKMKTSGAVFQQIMDNVVGDLQP